MKVRSFGMDHGDWVFAASVQQMHHWMEADHSPLCFPSFAVHRCAFVSCLDWGHVEGGYLDWARGYMNLGQVPPRLRKIKRDFFLLKHCGEVSHEHPGTRVCPDTPLCSARNCPDGHPMLPMLPRPYLGLLQPIPTVPNPSNTCPNRSPAIHGNTCSAANAITTPTARPGSARILPSSCPGLPRLLQKSARILVGSLVASKLYKRVSYPPPLV